MHHVLRRTTLAGLLAAALALAPAAPALAAPRAPAGPTATSPALDLLDHLATWLGGWLGAPGRPVDPNGPSGLRSRTAAGGGQIDPNGTSGTATSPDSGAPGTVTTEGGAWIDPSG